MHELNAGSRLGLSPRRADPHAHEKRPARLHTIGSPLEARGAEVSLATGVSIGDFDPHTTWNFLRYLIWDTPTEEKVKALKSVCGDWRLCLGHLEIKPLVDGILDLVTQLEADPTVATVNRLMKLDLPGSGPVSALMEEQTWSGGDGHPYRVVMGVLIGDLPRSPDLGVRFIFAPPQEAKIRVIPTNAFPHFEGAISVDLSNCDMLTHIRADAFGRTDAFGQSKMRIWDLVLPKNPLKLVSIGSRAFKHNPFMSRSKEVDLGRFTALEEIGQEAFGPIGKLNLSGCTALREIGARAFEYSQLTTLDLRGCVSLKTIGYRAFFNSFLTTLDLSRNTALETIGREAFQNSKLENLTMMHGGALWSIGGYAFYSAKLESLNLSNCTALEEIHEFAFTCSPLTTLYLNNKLRVIEKYAFQYAKLTDLHLSHCADLILIGDYSFRDSRLSKIQMPPSLMFVGNVAFYNSQIEYLNLSLCTNLQTIGISAFHKSPLRKLQLPVSIREIGGSAFFHAKLTQLDLKDCKHLQTIGYRAFYDSPLTTLDFRGVSLYVKIGTGAFQSALLDGLHGNNLAADLYGDPMITEDGGGGDDTNDLLPGDGGIPSNLDPMITEDGRSGDFTDNPLPGNRSVDDSDYGIP
jgi:hypothetical protein